MKSLLIPLITLFSSIYLSVNSQNYKWDWLKGGVNGFTAYQNVTDNSGNTYVVGSIGQANTVIGTTTYNPINGDGVLIKYDNNGNVLWSVVISGNAGEVFSGISIDGSGNLFLTGMTEGTLVTIGSSTFSNSGAFSFPDIVPFISKFDSNGNLLFLKFIGHTNYLSAISLKIKVGTNSVLIYGSSLLSSTLSISNNTFVSQNTDFFMASFDINANLNWVKFYSAPSYDFLSDLIVQKNDDVCFAGSTTSPSLTIENYTISNPTGTTNLGFVTLMNSMGNIKWLKTFSNADVSNPKLAALNTNAIYLGISFSSSALSIGSNTYASQNNDCLISQIDSLGNYNWSKLISGNNGGRIGSLAVNQNNYVYATGTSSSSVLSTSNYSVASSNTVNNLFFAAFDAHGKDWCILISSRPNSTSFSNIIPFSISMDANNNGYIVGTNQLDLVCGSYTISNTSQAPSFMAKIKLLNGVGIQESFLEKNEINIFPNPASSVLNFNSQTFKIASLEIYNTLGQSIYQKNYADLNQSLDVSFLNAGVYFVKIQNQFSQKTIKFIKE